ncbi:MAG: RNase J family beta-CASP ribonuclease [Methanosarcinales archaeon]|nr:RNase J family beta-CASP ribonuclease [Methanosarcinales archaeon]
MSDIGIIAVGGYNEMGRNMTAIRVGEDIVVFDMGLRLDMVQINEDVEVDKMHSLDLIKMGAIPDDTIMTKVDGNVRAIVCTHAHLDHIGAIPKLAHRYKAPIIGTPFTTAVIKEQIKGEQKFKSSNEIVTVNAGSSYEINADLTVELIRVQHSTIDCAFAALHTPEGTVLYGNDFKMDRTPTLGEAPDFKRLRKLSKENVLAMITESTNSMITGKTPSEQIAKDMARDVLLGTEESESGVVVTTFASHIARINALIEIAEEMGRTPVLMGRSMEKYVKLAEGVGQVELPDNLEMYGNRKTINNAFKRIMAEGKEKYLPIVTGHQGEPGAIMGRIANGETPYRMDKGDKVVFSANVIPTPMTRANRNTVEVKLKMQGARIYDGIHVSGHACKEDHWELLRTISPEHVIPAHGNLTMHSAYLEMAEDAGYMLGENAHILRNGEELLLE